MVRYRTRYGYWIQATGENPEALDAAGVDGNRVRYAIVIVVLADWGNTRVPSAADEPCESEE